MSEKQFFVEDDIMARQQVQSISKPEKSFVRFKDLKAVTQVYNHKGQYLGYIEFKNWRVHKQWIFCPDDCVFFTDGCLQEIQDKLKQLNRERPNGKNSN